jgi:hypothetical protein
MIMGWKLRTWRTLTPAEAADILERFVTSDEYSGEHRGFINLLEDDVDDPRIKKVQEELRTIDHRNDTGPDAGRYYADYGFNRIRELITELRSME